MVYNRANNDEVVYARRVSIDQEAETYQTATSQDVFTWEKQVPVEPGRYRIDVTVFDQNTSRNLTRTSYTLVPDPDQETSSVTNIRMYIKQIEKRNNRWRLIPTYDIPGRIDSLKFVFQVINKSDEPFVIDSELIKYDADTLAAKPMHASNYSPSGIRYKGIEYDDKEIIQSNRRVLTQKGRVTIEYFFPMLARGNYRFKITIEEGSKEEQFKARDFSIKSPGFPSIETPRELARPLIYLMNKREYDQLISIQNPDSLKAEVDRFWLRNVHNKSDARTIIRLFYQRVEQANKQFSNYKERSKIDRGMIYILFGKPWYENYFNKTLSWSYTYNLSDPYLNFNFIKVKIKSEYFPFDYYVLERSASYYNIHHRRIQLWLRGQILVRKL